MIDISAITELPFLKLEQMAWYHFLFYGFMFILILRLVVLCSLSLMYTLLKIKDDIKILKKESDTFIPFSIIVPAYNEEVTISSCIESMLNLDYPSYEVIVVDDGSKDKTLNEASKFLMKGVQVIHQENTGKPGAINMGIKNASGDIIITVDADSKLHPKSLKWISRRFSKNQRLGAVAGNVKIDHSRGVLKILQSLEYTTSINLGRKSQSLFHCVMIVPGAIAALKTEALHKAGYFSSDTFAEDFDITMRILQAGYHVEYESRAVAFTQAPESIEDLMKQRRRWNRGITQVLAKYQCMYMNPKYGLAGLVGVPYMWFEQGSCILNFFLLSMLITSAFINLQITSLTIGILIYWGLTILVSIFAELMDPMPSIREIIISPLYLPYNIFLDVISMMAFIEEILNITMKWEKPKREEM
ncbi:MAG TPA: glycosyltransferase [Candidatus Nanoarchaeia archaeon]|nr:glycosyltransferase [Candidatus Nanoarchaeia archaeon]